MQFKFHSHFHSYLFLCLFFAVFNGKILTWDEDVMAMFGLLQFDELSIGWGGGVNWLESCGLVGDSLLGHGGDGVDGSKSVTSIEKLRSALGGSSES